MPTITPTPSTRSGRWLCRPPASVARPAPVIDRYGGGYDVSAAPGGGAVITVRLPVPAPVAPRAGEGKA
jgi:hypothetical protein